MSWRQTRICNCIQCRQDCDLYSLLTQRDQVLATEHQWAGPMGRKRLLVDVLLWRRVYANVCAPVKDLLCANLIFHVMAPLTENIVMEYWKQHKQFFRVTTLRSESSDQLWKLQDRLDRWMHVWSANTCDSTLQHHNTLSGVSRGSAILQIIHSWKNAINTISAQMFLWKSFFTKRIWNMH